MKVPIQTSSDVNLYSTGYLYSHPTMATYTVNLNMRVCPYKKYLDTAETVYTIQTCQAIKHGTNKGNTIMQEIIKQAQEQKRRTMKREALVGNILCTVLGFFTLSAFIPWFYVG